MNFSHNKSIILIVLSTLVLASVGLWLLGGRSSLDLLGSAKGGQSSSQSVDQSTTFDKKSIDDEISSIDKISGDIKPDDLQADIISDKEVGLD
ncbi:MAG: hypothetical protein WCG48_03455 [Candidatus Berkelbacteria bacterium]